MSSTEQRTEDRRRRVRIGRAIERARKQCKIKACTMAARLGIDRTTVYCWESGRTTPRADQVPVICDLLGMHPSELLGMTPHVPRCRPYVRTIVDLDEITGLQVTATYQPYEIIYPPERGAQQVQVQSVTIAGSADIWERLSSYAQLECQAAAERAADQAERDKLIEAEEFVA